MESTHAVLPAGAALKPFSPGISWAVLPGDGMTLVYWVFEPPECGDVPLHDHLSAQGGIILEGAIHMRYAGGAEHTLRPGDAYVVRGGVPHGVRFTERSVVLDIFTPNREEYERKYAAGVTSERWNPTDIRV
jgi:quercetin dioxygenase-like cupin family protein